MQFDTCSNYAARSFYFPSFLRLLSSALVQGVFFHYDTQTMDARAVGQNMNVFKWNVKILQVSRGDALGGQLELGVNR